MGGEDREVRVLERERRLALMVLLSLLPIGIIQTIASVDKGLWYARSAELLQQRYMQNLKWLRAIGDTIFAVGIISIGWFVFKSQMWGPAPSPDDEDIDVKPSRRVMSDEQVKEPVALTN